MEPFETQIKRGKTIRLTHQEKSAHKAAILRSMQAHPIETRIPSPFNFNLMWLSRPLAMRIAAIVLIVGTISSGTLAYASEAALPGDALYGVKHMKEAVAVSLAPTTEARAQVQKKQIQTRLNEVKTLKQKGTFTKAKAEIVKNELAGNTAGLKATVATLNEEGKQDVVKNVTTELVASVTDLNTSTTAPENTSVSMSAKTAPMTEPVVAPEETPKAELITIGAFDFEEISSAEAMDAILSTSVATIDAVTDEDAVAVAISDVPIKEIDSKEQSSPQETSSATTVTLPNEHTTIQEGPIATIAIAPVEKTVQPKKIYSIFGKVTAGPFCVDVKVGNICEPPQDIFFGKTIAAYDIEKSGVIARSPITADGNYSLSLPSTGTYRLRVEGFGASFILNAERTTLTEESPIQVLNVAVTLNKEEPR